MGFLGPEPHNPIKKVKLGLHLLEFPDSRLPDFVFTFISHAICNVKPVESILDQFEKKGHLSFQISEFWELLC
jgi:hypothetical protein